MFRQYRDFEKGEFVVIGGDCSQGGDDYNCAQFLSKTKFDVPLVYHAQGVAAMMTPEIKHTADVIHTKTGVKPVIGLERNNGGGSEMERLRVLNREGKYTLFVMPKIGQTESEDTTKLGWDTNTLTRPVLVGELKNIIDIKGITVYDEKTIQEMFWFIVNDRGKPEAMKGKNDDTIIALAVAVQMFNYCQPPIKNRTLPGVGGVKPYLEGLLA